MDFLTKCPEHIEDTSFSIIQSQLKNPSVSNERLSVITRVIHATADFDFETSLVFSGNAISNAIDAIRSGAPIVTDVNMVKVGIRKQVTKEFGTKIICSIADDGVKRAAERDGTTRASAAMKISKKWINGGITVIGNSPTALYEVLRLIETEQVIPRLIIGVPVGFVDAEESKGALIRCKGVDYISNRGKKGGTPVAVAIINALIILAVGA